MEARQERVYGAVRTALIGYGKIGGRGVYVFAQDRTILAGTVGAIHGEKISYATQMARKLGVPLIGL